MAPRDISYLFLAPRCSWSDAGPSPATQIAQWLSRTIKSRRCVHEKRAGFRDWINRASFGCRRVLVSCTRAVCRSSDSRDSCKDPHQRASDGKGGSLIFRSGSQWTPNVGGNPNIASTTVTSNAVLTKLSIDGVTTVRGTLPTITETAGETGTALTNNWYVSLIFRDSGGSTLQICPYVNNNVCSASGSLHGETTLYLVGDGNGTFKIDNDGTGKPIQIDGQYLLRYELTSCDDGTTGDHTKCNHILRVAANLDGVSKWDDKDPVNTTTLWCYAGQCDIGIGQ